MATESTRLKDPGRPLADAVYAVARKTHFPAGAGRLPAQADLEDTGRFLAVRRLQRACGGTSSFRRAGARRHRRVRRGLLLLQTSCDLIERGIH